MDLTDQQHEEMLIPSFLVGAIMGHPRAETIQRIRTESGVRTLQFGPCSYSPKDKILHIVGCKEAVRRAKSMVDELMESITKDSVHEEIIVPHDRCGVVVGAGGERLSGIRLQFGLKVAHIDNLTEPGPDGKVLHLVGSASAIQAAKGKIAAYIDPSTAAAAEKLPPVRVLDLAKEQVRVPAYARGRVIGIGGGTIKRIRVAAAFVYWAIGSSSYKVLPIQLESGATVQFAHDSPLFGDGILDIYGTRESVERAKELVQEIIDSTAAGGGVAGPTRFAIPREMVSLLIGRSADMFRSVLLSTGARLHLDANELFGQSSILYVSINGSEHQRGQAMAYLNQLIFNHSHLMGNMFGPQVHPIVVVAATHEGADSSPCSSSIHFTSANKVESSEQVPHPAVAVATTLEGTHGLACPSSSPTATFMGASAGKVEKSESVTECRLETPPLPPPLTDDNCGGKDDSAQNNKSTPAAVMEEQAPIEPAAEDITAEVLPAESASPSGNVEIEPQSTSDKAPAGNDNVESGGGLKHDAPAAVNMETGKGRKEGTMRGRKRPCLKVLDCITIDDD